MKTLLSWSSGKDSAWTLRVLRARGAEIAGLLTTFNAAAARVAMHAVRRELVERQASAAGLPLWAVDLPWPCPNEQYESRMRALCERARAAGVRAIAFGDLFLTEVRQYRERQLRDTGLQPLFPLWGLDTTALASEMITGGLRARLTCVDAGKLPRGFAGREFDGRLLEELPAGVDPCGENGEFHSFVYGAPVFNGPIPVVPGETVVRDGFVFVDLLPAPVVPEPEPVM